MFPSAQGHTSSAGKGKAKGAWRPLVFGCVCSRELCQKHPIPIPPTERKHTHRRLVTDDSDTEVLLGMEGSVSFAAESTWPPCREQEIQMYIRAPHCTLAAEASWLLSVSPAKGCKSDPSQVLMLKPEYSFKSIPLQKPQISRDWAWSRPCIGRGLLRFLCQLCDGSCAGVLCLPWAVPAGAGS